VAAPRRIGSLVLLSPAGLRLPGHPVADIFLMSPDQLVATLFQHPPPAAALTPDIDAILAAYRDQTAVARFSWTPYLCNPKLERRLHRITAPAGGRADGGPAHPGRPRQAVRRADPGSQADRADRKPFSALSYDELLADGYAVVGSPASVAARLHEMYDELGGYGQLIGLFAIGPSTHEQTIRSTELFASEVIAVLRPLGVAAGA